MHKQGGKGYYDRCGSLDRLKGLALAPLKLDTSTTLPAMQQSVSDSNTYRYDVREMSAIKCQCLAPLAHEPY